jgi:hypothetical protein
MKKNLFILLLTGFSFVILACRNNNEMPSKITNSKPVYSYEEKLKSEVTEMRSFLGKTPKYNSDVAFFLDMKIESGRNRFFIYDLKHHKLIDKDWSDTVRDQKPELRETCDLVIQKARIAVRWENMRLAVLILEDLEKLINYTVWTKPIAMPLTEM